MWVVLDSMKKQWQGEISRETVRFRYIFKAVWSTYVSLVLFIVDKGPTSRQASKTKACIRKAKLTFRCGSGFIESGP
jgi:hypothetical protein